MAEDLRQHAPQSLDSLAGGGCRPGPVPAAPAPAEGQSCSIGGG